MNKPQEHNVSSGAHKSADHAPKPGSSTDAPNIVTPQDKPAQAPMQDSPRTPMPDAVTHKPEVSSPAKGADKSSHGSPKDGHKAVHPQQKKT